MKNIIPIFCIFVAACTGNSDQDVNVKGVESIASKLFIINQTSGDISEQWWPPELIELNPKSVYKTDKGIYIKLNSFFTEESGLYVPADDVTVGVGSGYDPGRDYTLFNF